MMFAWFVYYALATTIHPWYVAVLAALLPFTKYRFALLWLILVPLSYHACGNINYHENLWIIVFEYVPIYTWLLFEVGVMSPVGKWWALKRAEVKCLRILPFLNKGQKLLELGSGNGALSVLLQQEGMEVSPLDVKDKSIFQEIDVVIYDGAKLPYSDEEFDVCQLITMLHHTTNAEELIQEAKRVSKKVIVMEDVYENVLQKYLTWISDSIVNWEFYGHPHTNRTDCEWRQIFKQNGLEVEEAKYDRFLLFFKQVTYVLKSA
jgi:SAM-dependent methyltransferase